MSEAVDTFARRVPEAPYPTAAVAWHATVVLAVLYWLSILDRFIISLLVDPIKQDLGLTDLQFSMLQGFAFMGSFTLFGLVFGALADRLSRRKVIFVGVALWSIATAACGVAQSFWHFLLARIGVGVGEASLNPGATSMITDLFPREKLTTAMAVYGIGATVGSGTALLIGGAIVDLVSHLDTVSIPVLGDIRPWQVVFFIVGIPGALLAFSIFTVPEPSRRGLGTQQQPARLAASYTALFKFIRTQPRFFLYHYLGFTFASAIASGGIGWYPVHVSRSYGWSAGEIGATLGPALMLGGILSKVVSGRIVDGLFKRGGRDAQFRWFGISILLSTPIGIWAALSSNVWMFVVGIALFTMLVGGFMACAVTALNLVTPNELRGSGVAVFTTVAGLIGGSAGPVLIAATSELGARPSIGVGLAVTMAICCPLAALSLLLGLGAMRKAMADTERPAVT